MSFSIENDVKPLLPKHWEFRRLKEIADVTPSNVDKLSADGEQPVLLCNYVDTYKNEKITSKIDFMKATATTSQIERLSLAKGDITITKDSESPWDIAVPAYIGEDIEGLVCGYHLSKISPNPERMVGSFLAWALRCKSVNLQFTLISQGITRYGLNSSGLSDGRVPCPPVDEQIAIAAYLDAETQRIDGLIDEKRNLLSTLVDLRVTRITEILTGTGLEQKNTGSEWLPKIPKSWELKRLKFLGQVRSGVAKGKKYDGQTTVEMPYLRVANVQDGYLKLDEISMIEVSTEEVERYTLLHGDVLMNEGGDYDKLGRGAVWESQVEGCLHQNHVFAVRLDDVSLADWVSAITQTAYAKFYFMNNSKQSTNLASINQGNVKEFPVVLPPQEERLFRQKMLQDELARIDELVTHTKREIDCLGEFRSSTITDVVLGRLRVPPLTPKANA